MHLNSCGGNIMNAQASAIRNITQKRTGSIFRFLEALLAWAVVIGGAALLYMFTIGRPCQECSLVGLNKWQPDAGYDWIDATDTKKGVQWTPGSKHPTAPYVIASSSTNAWEPAPGFSWVQGKAVADLRVKWETGIAHPRINRLTSGSGLNSWVPDPGYKLTSIAAGPLVVWTPGLEHSKFKNIVASEQEGYFQAAPGYWFSIPGQLSDGVWKPGLPHSTAKNVIASAIENKWLPASGYVFANETPGNLDVIPAPSRRNCTDALAAGAGALITHGASRPQADDGFLMTFFLRPFAKSVSDDLKKEFVNAFPCK
jgi:hypothetical protein